jgi:hypothetical protein
MNMIAERLNFTYVIKSPVDNKYGIYENDSWNGMVKMLLDGVKPFDFIFITSIVFKLSTGFQKRKAM